VRYSFGDFYTDPSAVPNLMDWISRHTKIRCKIVGGFVRLTDRELLKNPILLVTGHQAFEFSEEERKGLRNYLFNGGFLFVDDCGFLIGGPFDVSMRREIRLSLGAQLYNSMYRIPPGGQEILHAYFDFEGVPVGDEAPDRVYPWVEAIDLNNRTILIYSNKDLFCVLEEGYVGHGHENPQHLHPDVAKFMTNVIVYVLKTSPLVNSRDYFD